MIMIGLRRVAGGGHRLRVVYLDVCSCFLVQPPVPLINTFWAGFKVPVIVVFFKWINLRFIIIKKPTWPSG